MKHVAALVLFLMSMATPWSVAAGESRDWAKALMPAQAALARGNFNEAYSLYLQEADWNPLAQFTLGQFHQNGWGRAKDPAAACRWYERAAQRQIPGAEFFWGDCLAQGLGQPADIPAAINWYDKAASHGAVLAWCSAADYYIRGKGVAKDTAKGLALCTQAAKGNSPPAMLKLARYYQDGQILAQDLAAARYWYEQAAQIHVNEAQYELGLMLVNGEGGAADAKAGLLWLETAASEGYAPAYLATAMLYAQAPREKDTGMLAPEYLAKVYLWTKAAKARSNNSEQRAQAENLEAQVLAVMPASWRPALDKQVAEHLSKYAR